MPFTNNPPDITAGMTAAIATHAGIPAAHQDAPALIATHEALPTVHQDAPALITTHGGIADAHHTVSIPRTEAWLHDELLEDSIAAAVFATVADFQVNPGTGTFYNPQDTNDNNTANASDGRIINEYVEVDFGKPVIIKRWRQFGHAQNDGSGRFKLQYWSFLTDAWADWVTEIPTRATADWSGFTTETAVLTSKVRLICTTVDTNINRSFMGELEVIF